MTLIRKSENEFSGDGVVGEKEREKKIIKNVGCLGAASPRPPWTVYIYPLMTKITAVISCHLHGL